MASINVQRVTKSPTYLNKPEDWISWLFQYEDLATAAGVWTHCDPSKPYNALEDAPLRPTRPSSDATADQIKLYSLDRSDWEHDYRIWKRKEETLTAILTDIPTTISKNFILLIKNEHTVWGRLHALHQHLAPSDSTRKRELRQQWEDFQRITGRRIHGATFSATLGITNNQSNQGRPSATNSLTIPSKPSASSKRPHTNCYCGVTHWYCECPYLVTHKRPHNWKEDNSITAKFREARTNPKVNT
ncbi:hypothetical protein EJ04DRAFT_554052 [Polyplosphaeria fusca]|uniref:Uncharacterized protein n=1 Tax=Polyplosphaeria fusca TaxID=682080 RepID=A0A9P4UZG0_9PLEO|nr:hypothetical protein EJ04DRAFT_554052 [Polyplosphaeria fusca]